MKDSMREDNFVARIAIFCLIVSIIFLPLNIAYGRDHNYQHYQLTNKLSQNNDNVASENNNLKHPTFIHQYGPWILAATAGIPLFAADKKIHTFSQHSDMHSKGADNFFKAVHLMGAGWEYAAAIPLFGGYGLINKNKHATIIAGELFGGLAVIGVTTLVFKKSFGRLRPYQSNLPGEFFDGGMSFFSGDVSTAFTFSTIIAKNYPRQNLGFIGIHNFPLIPLFMYTAAGLVGLQRLYSNNHWSSDVYYGALAGYAVGTIAVHFGKIVNLTGFAITPDQTNRITAIFSLK
jgi:membrane-associated phospholipid phosphatase